MKLRGKTIPLHVVTVVLPREGEDLVFKFKATPDIKEFERLVPPPAKVYLTSSRTGEQKLDDSPSGLRTMREREEKYNNLRTAYMFITSIAATEGLEWETVDLNNPETWLNFQDELAASNISKGDFNALLNGMLQANSLDDDKLEEARLRFLQKAEQTPQ